MVPHSAFRKMQPRMTRIAVDPKDFLSAFIRVIRGQNLGFPLRVAFHAPFWVYEFRLSVVAARSARLHVWASAFCILEAARRMRIARGISTRTESRAAKRPKMV